MLISYQGVRVHFTARYWTAEMTIFTLILAAATALNPVTVNQGVVGSSPTSGAKINHLAANSAAPRPIKREVSNTLTATPTGQGVIPLSQFESTPGESLDAFILRIAKPMAAWSAESNAEACGAITRKGDLFSVVVTTQGSQVQCDSVAVRKGWTYIGETVHTHAMPGADGVLTVTAATAAVSGGQLRAGERIKPVHGPSSGDYDLGPGYVILGDEVVHQSGRSELVAVNSR